MGFNDNPYIKIKYADTDYSKVIVDGKTVWRKPLNYKRNLYIVNNSGAIKSHDAIAYGGLTFSLYYKNNNSWVSCLPPEQNNTTGENAIVLTDQRVIKYEDTLKYVFSNSNGYELRTNTSKMTYPNGEEISLSNNTEFIAYNDFVIDIRIKPILYSLNVSLREGVESYTVYRTAGNIATIQGVESGYITTSDTLYYGDVLTITVELQEGYTNVTITEGYTTITQDITVTKDINLTINASKIYGYYRLNKDAGVTSVQVWLNDRIAIGESYPLHYGDVLKVRNVTLVEGYYLVDFVDTYTFLPTQNGEILNINLTTDNKYNLYLKNNSAYIINNIPAGETALYGTYAYGSQVSIQLYCEGSYSEVKYTDIYEDTTLNINCEKRTRQYRQWVTLSTPAHIQEDTYKGYGSFKEAWYNKEGRTAVGWSCSDSYYYGFNPISRPEGCTWVRITWDGNYYAFQLPQQSAYNNYTPNTLPWGENGNSYGFDFNLISPTSISIGYDTYYLEFNAESTSDGDSDYYIITVYMTVPENQFSYSTYKQKLQNLEYGTNDLVIETTYLPYFED